MRRLIGNGPHLPWMGNLLDFLEFRQALSTYDGDLRDPLLWPQERPVPKLVARGPLGIPLPSISGPKTLGGVGARPEVSSPVLTWILGYFWSLPSGVSPGLLLSAFLLSCSSSVKLPFAWIKGSVAFPQGFPTRLSTGLSHEAFPQGCPSATVV